MINNRFKIASFENVNVNVKLTSNYEVNQKRHLSKSFLQLSIWFEFLDSRIFDNSLFEKDFAFETLVEWRLSQKWGFSLLQSIGFLNIKSHKVT